MSKRKPDLAALVRQLAEAAGVTIDAPANDAEQIDKEAIRERVERSAERMIRARKR